MPFGADDVLLASALFTEGFAFLARLAELGQQVMAGKPVTQAQLDAAKQASHDAADRLAAAVEARINGGHE